MARPEFDLGTAPATLPMERMLLVLKRGPEQEAALETLLDDQQDKNSSNYHKWLTPEEFGQQFGPTDSDMQTIISWLQSHGFQVGTTKGRTALEFSGSASQVQEAFHTTIHKYIVNGEQHWANAGDPSIPTALTPAVAGVLTLHNFQKKAQNLFVGRYSEKGKQVVGAPPNFTVGCGSSECYALVPYDFATIYDVLPLWNAATPINGTGQTIAIVGRTNINPSDATTFWSLFGLKVPANKLQITLNGPDPGINGDEAEADIDVQWSGAVAPQATINLVTSQSTETTDGVDLSAVYIVENNLASVMSESYGACELAQGTAGNQFMSALWGQAAAQGITVMVSSGDNGAAGCDAASGPAQDGLAVNGNASTPYNVAVGGTDFNQYNKLSTYWNSTNNATTQASAKGYIPETTWNNSCTNGLAITLGYGTTAEQACNNSSMIAAGGVNSTGGSGGPSNCTVNTQGVVGSCTQGYSKPSWQTGTGVPADGKRDLPDVSLFASNGFMYSFYIVCQSDVTNGVCDLNDLAGFGGTSVSSPAFAGIMALVNQYTGSRQGNANYVLYKLAAKQPTAFHDVPSGSTIAMPCVTGSPNCTTTTAGDTYGVLGGYNTTAGYDLATGLGSVDANVLVTKWDSVTLLPSTTTLSSLTPTTITHGQPVNFTVSVKPQSGTGTPTGQITLLGGTGSTPQGVGGFTLANGTVSGSTEMLPGGTYSVTAHYPGDATYGSSDSSPVTITVNKENSQPQAFLVTFDSIGNVVNGNTTTATYGSPYLLRINMENAVGQMCSPAASSTATACPTGTVTLSDNGSPLDAGTYTLNSYGYFEDVTVQLPGGANSLQASYAGDNSFNASSNTTAITISPAPTTISPPQAYGGQVGSPLTVSTSVSTQSNGVAPSGTVSFFVNGLPLAGTVQYTPYNGAGTLPASLAASISYTPTTSGTFTYSASYGGDTNYASAPVVVGSPYVVQYPAPAVYVQSNSYTVTPPATVTLTAEIIATGNVTPTGTVKFINSLGPLNGVTYSTVVNSTTGYKDLLASLTFAPTFTDNYNAQYSGDGNYPGGNGGVTVTATGNDFTLVFPQPSITVVRGSYAQLNLLVGMQNGTSRVTFSASPCTGLPAEATCGVGGVSVQYTSMQLLDLSASAPHSSAASVVGFPRDCSWSWVTGTASMLAGVLLVGSISTKRRRLPCVLALQIVLLLLLVPSCGGGGGTTTSGGGGGGGSTDPGTPVGSYKVTVTATSGSISHGATFTMTVQ